MVVMPSNNTGMMCGVLSERYKQNGKSRIALLMSPGGWRRPVCTEYALDNGAFGAWKNSTEWSASDFIALLDKAKSFHKPPIWVVAPDVLGDKEATLAKWSVWAPKIREYGFPVAFAAQDGMDPISDVPDDAHTVFIGGTTEWKLRNMQSFCDAHPRVHIARVNTYKRLMQAFRAGAVSVDGTGFFRGNQPQLQGLIRFFEETGGAGDPQQTMELK